jgi:hypothetical protein
MKTATRQPHPVGHGTRILNPKHRLLSAIFVLALVIIWGCSPGPPVVDETNGAAEAVEREPAREEPTVEATRQAAQEEATGQAKEPADEIEPSNSASTGQPTQAGNAAEEISAADSAEGEGTVQAVPTTITDQAGESDDTADPAPPIVSEVANVILVEATGEPGAYRFSVEISSPDQGCQQYADWWEVLSEDGELLYRRILAHSHVNEQPFVRSGGPVPIGAETVVWVRVHMNPGGYGGTVYKGSVQAGFEAAELSPEFAAEADGLAPLPGSCAF